MGASAAFESKRDRSDATVLPHPGMETGMNVKKSVLIILGLVFVGSVAARLVLGEGRSDPSPSSISSHSLLPEGSSGLLPTVGGGTPQPAPEVASEDDGFIVKSLPFFTEASFFGLIGFALGYFSRKVVKLMLIFIALLFVAAQVLQYAEIVTIDWQRMIDVLNDMILNLKQNETIGQILKDRIPTAGALVAGYAFGFRRG